MVQDILPDAGCSGTVKIDGRYDRRIIRNEKIAVYRREEGVPWNERLV